MTFCILPSFMRLPGSRLSDEADIDMELFFCVAGGKGWLKENTELVALEESDMLVVGEVDILSEWKVPMFSKIFILKSEDGLKLLVPLNSVEGLREIEGRSGLIPYSSFDILRMCSM
mgnify:CR=1 FL=1|jgi:hypothetical protein